MCVSSCCFIHQRLANLPIAEWQPLPASATPSSSSSFLLHHTLLLPVVWGKVNLNTTPFKNTVDENANVRHTPPRTSGAFLSGRWLQPMNPPPFCPPLSVVWLLFFAVGCFTFAPLLPLGNNPRALAHSLACPLLTCTCFTWNLCQDWAFSILHFPKISIIFLFFPASPKTKKPKIRSNSFHFAIERHYLFFYFPLAGHRSNNNTIYLGDPRERKLHSIARLVVFSISSEAFRCCVVMAPLLVWNPNSDSPSSSIEPLDEWNHSLCIGNLISSTRWRLIADNGTRV